MNFTNLRRVFASNTTLLMVCLSLGAMSTSVSAATFRVNSSDDNDDGLCDSSHCSLREAINTLNAAGGGIIRFDPTVFPRSGTAAPAIVPTSELPWIFASRSTVDGSGARVVLDGMGLTANGLTIHGLQEGSVSRVTIREIAVNNFTYDGIITCGGNCDTGPVSRILIEKVSVANNGLAGIVIRASSIGRVTMRDSIAIDNGGWGIALFSNISSLNRATVSGCTVRNNNSGGIYLESVANIDRARVTANNAVANQGSGIQLSTLTDESIISSLTVDHNTAVGNSGIGIQVFAAGDLRAPKLLNNVVSNNASGILLSVNAGLVRAQLKGNVATGNAGIGINLLSSGETSGAQLIANSVTGNGEHGIQVNGGSRAKILRNTASGNNGAGIYLEGPNQGNRIERNVTSANGANGLFVSGGSIDNKLQRNEARGNSDTDLLDSNGGDCGGNMWRRNKFGSADPACIQ